MEDLSSKLSYFEAGPNEHNIKPRYLEVDPSLINTTSTFKENSSDEKTEKFSFDGLLESENDYPPAITENSSDQDLFESGNSDPPIITENSSDQDLFEFENSDSTAITENFSTSSFDTYRRK